MVDSNGGKVNLRIRFAGLCLFVPHREGGHVHVLMPHEHDHHAHQAQQSDAPNSELPEHLLCLYWVSGGVGEGTSLSKELELKHDGWPAASLTIPEVFDVKHVSPPAGCSAQHHGQADLKKHRKASLLLHSGGGKIVNRGSKWKIGGRPEKHAMPTVMDWWVRGIDHDELMGVLNSWGVFGEKRPDVGQGNTITLWIIHAPEKEQDPGHIGRESQPDPAERPHFRAYYSLLRCEGYTEDPTGPEPQVQPVNVEEPTWPGLGREQKEFAGSFRNCMLAQAEMTESADAE